MAEITLEWVDLGWVESLVFTHLCLTFVSLFNLHTNLGNIPRKDLKCTIGNSDLLISTPHVCTYIISTEKHFDFLFPSFQDNISSKHFQQKLLSIQDQIPSLKFCMVMWPVLLGATLFLAQKSKGGTLVRKKYFLKIFRGLLVSNERYWLADSKTAGISPLWCFFPEIF